MKIKTEYFSFVPKEMAENNIEKNLLENIRKRVEIFNEKLEINKKKKIFEINFSFNFSTERIDVHVKMEGVKNIKILIKTPFSFGHSVAKKALKKMFLSSLNETLKYY